MKYYTITVNGKVYEVTVEEGFSEGAVIDKSKQAAVEHNPVPIVPKKTNASVGSVKISAPMPGKILEVKVNVGQRVKRGEALMILEAMKMENDIVAPEDGTVSSVQAAEGSAVEAGDLLVTLD